MVEKPTCSCLSSSQLWWQWGLAWHWAQPLVLNTIYKMTNMLYILVMNLIHPPLATFLLLRLTWLSPGCTTSPWNRYVILFSTLLNSRQSMVACLPSLLSRLSLPQFDMQETVWAQIILKVGHNHWNSETNFDVKNISHDMHVLPSISCQWETQSFISRPPPWPWPSWQWCWHCPWLKWKAPFLASLSASTSRFDDFWMDSCLQLSVLDLDSIQRQEILMWLALTNWGDWNRQWRGHSCFLWNLHLLHFYFSREDQQQDNQRWKNVQTLQTRLCYFFPGLC